MLPGWKLRSLRTSLRFKDDTFWSFWYLASWTQNMKHDTNELSLLSRRLNALGPCLCLAHVNNSARCPFLLEHVWRFVIFGEIAERTKSVNRDCVHRTGTDTCVLSIMRRGQTRCAFKYSPSTRPMGSHPSTHLHGRVRVHDASCTRDTCNPFGPSTTAVTEHRRGRICR